MIKKIIALMVLLLINAFSFAQTLTENNFSSLQPAALIDVAARYRHALIAELDLGKMHIFKRLNDDSFELLRTMEVSIGKDGYGKQVEGDNKTPIGVYRVTSHLTNEQLDDFYGNAAYPVNYPNAWDRLQKRTGYGIWLHAEPVGFQEKTRPLRDSNGCVVLSNNDIDALSQYIDIGYTYIVLTPKMEMTSLETIQGVREKIYQRLHGWRDTWQSLETESYLEFYSKSFDNLKKDWPAWAKYKRRVNASKKFINVGFSDVGIYAYPNEENLLWVEFYQSYRSSNFYSQGWKRQLWKLEEDNQWRIIYEGGG